MALKEKELELDKNWNWTRIGTGQELELDKSSKSKDCVLVLEGPFPVMHCVTALFGTFHYKLCLNHCMQVSRLPIIALRQLFALEKVFPAAASALLLAQCRLDHYYKELQ